MITPQNTGNEPLETEMRPLELNEFIKMVGFHQTSSHISSFHYLDLELVNQNDPSGSPGEPKGDKILGLKHNSMAIELETQYFQSVIPEDSIRDLSAFGINPSGTIQKALEVEESIFVQKEIFSKMYDLGEKKRKSLITGFWKFALDRFGWDFGTRIEGRSDRQKSDFIVSRIISASNKIAKDSRRGPADFIVVSAGMGNFITDHPYLQFTPLNGININDSHGIYQIGILGIGAGIKVFVNPFLLWKDFSVLVGRKTESNSPGVHLVEYKRELIRIEEPPSPTTYTSQVKTILKSRRSIKAVGKSASDLYRVEKFRMPKKIFWKFYI